MSRTGRSTYAGPVSSCTSPPCLRPRVTWIRTVRETWATRPTSSSTSLPTAGCSVWQVLPLVPTHEEDGSPYNALSAMAGNPELISARRRGRGRASTTRRRWTTSSATRSPPGVLAHADWLRAVRRVRRPARAPRADALADLAEPLRDRDPHAVAAALAPHADRVRDAALRAVGLRAAVDPAPRVRRVAGGAGLRRPADLRVARQRRRVGARASSSSWTRDGRPTTVTGLPARLLRRRRPALEQPALRLGRDGGRRLRLVAAPDRAASASCSTWSASTTSAASRRPGTCRAGAATARDGWWVPGPGPAILSALVDAAGAGHPGGRGPRRDHARGRGAARPVRPAGDEGAAVRVRRDPDNPYLPAHHGELSVVYTGTHDNDTTAGWWAGLDERDPRPGARRPPRPRRADALGADPPRPGLDRPAGAWCPPRTCSGSAARPHEHPWHRGGQLDLAGAGRCLRRRPRRPVARSRVSGGPARLSGRLTGAPAGTMARAPPSCDWRHAALAQW